MKEKKTYRFSIIAIAMFMAAGAVILLAGCSKNDTAYQRNGAAGRTWEAQEVGDIQTLSGTLSFSDPEWHLSTVEGKILLGLGNRTYPESTSLDLVDGKEAVVTGYLADEELSVFTVSTAGETVTLRTQVGAPLWAGRGAGGGGRGAGQNREVPQTNGAPDPPEGVEPLGDGPPADRGPASDQGAGRGGGRGTLRGFFFFT